MRSEELKGKIKSHRLNVINLTFTKDGRLVEKTDSMMRTPVVNYNYGNPGMYQGYYRAAQPRNTDTDNNIIAEGIDKGLDLAWNGVKFVGKTAWKVTKFTVKTICKGVKGFIKAVSRAR